MSTGEEIDPTDVVRNIPDEEEIDPTSVVRDEMPEASTPGTSVPDEKYQTPSQQILTGVEGAAEGALGKIAPAAESYIAKGLGLAGAPGFVGEDSPGQQQFSSEGVNARKKANPVISAAGQGTGLVGSLLTGVGEVPAISGAVKAILPTAESAAAKVGSSILGNMISTGVIRGTDKVSEGILGQSDPSETVGSAIADVGAASLLSGTLGGVSGLAGNTLEKVANKNLGFKLQSFLAGIGSNAGASELPEASAVGSTAAFKAGQKAQKYLTGAASIAGAYEGYEHGGLLGAMAGANFGGLSVNKHTLPVILRVLGSGEADSAMGEKYNQFMQKHLYDALDYANNAGSGLQKANSAINGLFQAGSAKIENNEKAGQKVKDYIDNGGIHEELKDLLHNQSQEDVPGNYAEGGDIQPKPKEQDATISGLGKFLPEHEMMLNMARTRVSNYLSSLKPQKNMYHLPFDDAPDTSDQEKTYNEAINIANHPMNILGHIKNGTLDSEHLDHFNAMFPETVNMMKRRMTDRIIKAQVSGEKPPYHVRQGMSMFMGQDLTGDITPQNIMAAQNTFTQAQSQPQSDQQLPKSKKGSSALSKMGSQTMTSLQARSQRQQQE